VTVHANIMWQPVKQMKLGWEVMWGEIDYAGDDQIDSETYDDVRLQFGAWFYF
jgi:hypothetical protein